MILITSLLSLLFPLVHADHRYFLVNSSHELTVQIQSPHLNSTIFDNTAERLTQTCEVSNQRPFTRSEYLGMLKEKKFGRFISSDDKKSEVVYRDRAKPYVKVYEPKEGQIVQKEHEFVVVNALDIPSFDQVVIQFVGDIHEADLSECQPTIWGLGYCLAANYNLPGLALITGLFQACFSKPVQNCISSTDRLIHAPNIPVTDSPSQPLIGGKEVPFWLARLYEICVY